ncbi:MAG: ZIP family metal transporter [Candidatus Diapherotrites archaeon]|nr:ZIP family metal transporter [Candidatus Diapherotrites archaeon]
MDIQAIAFLIAAIAATFFGGFLATKFEKNLKLLVALSSGLLIGIAFFDLLPEAFGLSEARLTSFFLAFGFLLYFLLERFILVHPCTEKHCDSERHAKPSSASAILGLVLHRFLDGAVIILSFKTSPQVGIIVALAIVVHSIPDGVNSVTVMLLRKKNQFWKWFIALAIAVFAGAGTALALPIDESQLGFLIAFVAGWFLYLGASDLLPEAHKQQKDFPALLATLAGFVAIAIATMLLKF